MVLVLRALQAGLVSESDLSVTIASHSQYLVGVALQLSLQLSQHICVCML